MFNNTQKYLLQVGSFLFEIESNVSAIRDYLTKHYKDHLTSNENQFIDYSISIKHGKMTRRLLKPQVEFFFNHLKPFKPLPLDQAHVLLEWGINWVISTQAHQYLIIHAASLEKNGKGLIISAPSGSGKSTLCAYLVSQGWRLLSDELALIDSKTLEMHSIARPMNLKNESIDIMLDYYEKNDFSKIAEDTYKGRVSLLQPSMLSTKNTQIKAIPHLFVFINFNKNENTFIEKVDKSTAMMEIIQNSFNFGLLSNTGFQCVKDLINMCNALYIEYSDFQSCEKTLNHYMEEDNYCEKVN